MTDKKNPIEFKNYDYLYVYRIEYFHGERKYILIGKFDARTELEACFEAEDRAMRVLVAKHYPEADLSTYAKLQPWYSRVTTETSENRDVPYVYIFTSTGELPITNQSAS